MSRKPRLELTWVGKDERPKLEPRVLVEDQTQSYCNNKFSDLNAFENVLIKGDNLLALKAIQHDYTGSVKCIYIDPPYNTGAALSYYDDGMEHSAWLALMRERIELLWELLSIDGTIWVSIDDSEMPYLRVLMDEVCGREHFVCANVWQKRYSRENRGTIGDAHEYVIVYAKDKDAFKSARNKLPLGEKQLSVYRNPNNDPKGPWRSVSLSAQGYRPNQMYEIVAPSGKKHVPPEGSCWKIIEKEYTRLVSEGRIYFGKNGDAVPSRIQYLIDIDGIMPWTWWPHEEVGHTDEAKREVQRIFGKSNAFDTPKPERLVKRVLDIATNPGDLVLDSFAGSGTTGAVAHKMGRRWLMVELGDHADTHIVPRMKKVINGDDPGGVTKMAGWEGGGGFRYYTLAPSLLEKDRFGNWVISKKYDPNLLAHAICKLMGFTFEPSQNEKEYWRHGHSTETDFIFVTTQSLTHDALRRISEDVGPNRTLLVCCKAFRAKEAAFPNLTLKKIPQAVLQKCEWGRDDYSLKIAALQPAENDPVIPEETGETAAPTAAAPKTRKRKKRKTPGDETPDLFANRTEA